MGTTEEFLLAAASVDEQILDAELTDKLVSLPGRAELLRRTATATPPGGVASTVATDSGRFAFAAAPIPLPPLRQAALDQQCQSLNLRIEPRNLALLSEESDKLDAWADDLKVGLERKIKGPDRRVKETRSKGKSAATLAEKLASQTEQRELESTRDRKRREPFARQDQIQARRDKLIEEMESPLAQHGSARLVLDSEWVMS